MNQLVKNSLKHLPIYMVVTMWMIHGVSNLFSINLNWLGTHPRHFVEWYTFLSGALIHSDFQHLTNNTYPILITGLFIFFLFGKYSNFVFITTYFFTGLFIFLFARGNTYHIGASGIAYSWAFLLAASGFFRNDRLSMGLGIVVVLLYGGMIWGVLPLQPGVSWDGHLIGAITGILFAYLYRNINKKDDVDTKPVNHYQFDRYNYGDYAYLNRQKENREVESQKSDLFE